MPVPTLSRLNPENPWPGLESFSERDAAYFHGREAEAAELLRLTRRESLTVLFGASGLGKTSLLNAGLFPALRQDGLLPVYVRVQFSGGGPGPRAQVLDRLSAECTERRIEAPQPAGSATLWEYFHRVDTEFWSDRNRPVTPVLVFDQFEEVFTLGQASDQSRERCREFLTELGELIENRVPRRLRESLDEDPDMSSQFDFRQVDLKLIVSFREDYLAHVEGLKRQVPSLTYNRFRLAPMNGQQAHDVVIRSGGHLVDDTVAAFIIGISAGRGAAEQAPDPDVYGDLEIDPALLSVICSELNKRRQRAGEPRITRGLISGAEYEILADFYERSMAGLDPRVRVFVEDELLTDKGYRDSFALEDAAELAGITQPALDALVEGRLLRVDDRFGVRRLELTHDVLTGVVRESRDHRKAREAEAAAQAHEREAARRARRNRIVSGLLAIGVVIVLGFFGLVSWLWLEVNEQKQRADGQEDRANKLFVVAKAAEKTANQLKEEADRLLNRAKATELVRQAQRLEATQYDLALLLNVEAKKAAEIVEVRAGFVDRFLSHPYLDSFLAGDGELLSVAFSPDGQLLASASGECSVILWDMATRQRVDTLMGHGGAVLSVAFSPDGRLLASAGEDGTVILWDVAKGQRVQTLKGHEKRVLSVAFSPDGRLLASASYDKTVILWDVSWGEEVVKLHHDVQVLGVAFSPDGKLLASASDDNKAEDDNRVILWDMETRQRLHTFEGHEERVRSVAFSPDGGQLASASEDNTVILWDVTKRTLLKRLKGHEGDVLGVAFSPNGSRLASASADETVILWDVAERKQLAKLAGHRARVQGVAFGPDGKQLASASKDKHVILWDARSRESARVGRLFDMLKPPGKKSISSVAFSPDRDARLLASAGDDSKVVLWDLSGRKPPAVLTGHVKPKPVTGVALSPDGKLLASASKDKTVILWDVATHESLVTLREHTRSVLGVAFSPDGKLLASASYDKSVILWDVATRRKLAGLTGHDKAVRDVAFSPDGKLLASASDDQSVILWDVATREQVDKLKEHTGKVWRVAFSPDGSLLASGSDDATVILWDMSTSMSTRKYRARLTGHVKDKGVIGVAFSPSGQVLASAGEDHKVIMWDVEAAKPLATFEGHDKAAVSVAFSPDGGLLASAGDDGKLILWNWSPEFLAEQACRVANRNLSRNEWRQFMPDLPYRETCGELP